jgi:DNA-binding response OmpR family regulator
MTVRVLLVDDDEALTALLVEYLARFGMAASTAAHPQEAFRLLKADPPDVLVLDVMLPGMDGFAVCRKVRETSDVPIVMLTARGDLADRVVGLELGADDYMPKPFEPRELVARVQALHRRRSKGAEEEVLRSGAVVLDLATHPARLADEELSLSTELGLALFSGTRARPVEERLLDERAARLGLTTGRSTSSSAASARSSATTPVTRASSGPSAGPATPSWARDG